MPAFEKIKKILTSNYNENLPYIVVGLISGLACCLYAMLFSFLERRSMQLFHHYPYAPFILSPLMMILSYWLIRKFAPGAAGSGIPQVMTCIEPEHRERTKDFLNLRIIVMKVGSSAAAIFGGAVIGREGPSLQISASIGALVSKQARKMGVTIKSEQLLIAGAASGLAAAFNTPIGGIIYAIEELSLEHVRSYKTVLILSVVIAGFIAQMLMGNYLYLGYPIITNSIDWKILLVVAGVSFFTGILGACFSELLIILSSWRKKRSLGGQILIAAGVGLIIAGTYYFLGERAVYSGKESINFVLFEKTDMGFLESFARFAGPLLSSMTGIAGGIFAPSLSAGAALGGFVASLLEDPTLRSLLGVIGMIGFLTGVTRTPITSFVLVQEMTDRHSAIMPMMLAAFFSSLGASLLGHKSFYERVAHELKATT